MTAPYRVSGTVPPDSPLRALTGRTVTAPAETLEEMVRRITEMRRARIDPIVLAAPRPVPWTPIIAAQTAAVLAALATALIAILTDHPATAWTAAGVMVLSGLLLLITCLHMEMDR